MPLEDDFCDIIKKARMGQGLGVADVARVSGLPGTDIIALEHGDQPRDRAEVRAIATALGLRPDQLEQIAIDRWTPKEMSSVSCVETVHGDIGGYAVKGYVVHDSGEAMLVDTAYNAPAMVEVLRQKKLHLVAICLTHGHADHSDGLDRLLKQREVPVFLGPDDLDLVSWRPRSDLLAVPEDGRTITVGRLTLRCLTTPGHTPGGICYRVEHDGQTICFVGDTLFAGSIGRSNPSKLYAVHLDSVRKRVLKLPDDTLLFPGHGPATTVREELTHNPFASAA